MSVNVSGAVLSSLFYDQNNIKGDNEGFLLGKIVNHITDEISDSHLTNVKEKTVIYVYSYIPFIGLYNWYNPCGRINHDTLKDCFETNKIQSREIVGWYKFRRNTSFVISMRERAVHRHLTECFPAVDPASFVFCLCTASTAYNHGIHSFDHAFHSFNGRTFQGLPVTVENLGDTAQSEYKCSPSLSANSSTGVYNDIIDQYRYQVADSQGKLQSLMSFKSLNSKLHQQLMELCLRVAETEKIRAELELETDKLEKEVMGPQKPLSKEVNTVVQPMRNPFPEPIPSSSPILVRKAASSSTYAEPPAEEEADLIVLDDFEEGESTDVPAWAPLNISNNKSTREQSKSPLLESESKSVPTIPSVHRMHVPLTAQGTASQETEVMDSFDELWHSVKPVVNKTPDKRPINKNDKSKSGAGDKEAKMKVQPQTRSKNNTEVEISSYTSEEDMQCSPTF